MVKLTKKQLEIIQRLGYQSIEDIVTHYPYRYELLEQKDIAAWKQGDSVVFEGILCSDFKSFRFNKNQSKTSFTVQVGDELISVTIFNRPYLKSSLFKERITVIGTVGKNNSVIAKTVNAKPIEEQLGIVPKYSLKANIKNHEIIKIVKKVLDSMPISDIVPQRFIHRYRLMKRKDALYKCHFPKNYDELYAGLRTLKYEEFLVYHTVNAINAHSLRKGFSKQVPMDVLDEKIKKLPFTLTQSQDAALNDILNDLKASRSMHRLLQGDVGSGKTIVALLAAYASVKSGYQVAFLAPTEILSEQHYRSARLLFPNISIFQLTQSTSSDKSLAALKNGEIDLVIGTHALFQENVFFSNLGLVIIDEQHRFGVQQRKALIKKGNKPDVLMLSATPIPRTLATSLYFDLDVSTIDEYPNRRTHNKTVLIEENSMRTIVDELKQALAQGIQIYVVCPSIKEATLPGHRDVETITHELRKVFNQVRVEMIHGKTTSDEKKEIMNEFKEGKINVLVATTVIEVGIDVPNANRMVIYNAEMFGLATLHQLRGRIGRGKTAGICYLLSNNKNEEANQRLKFLCETHDGFKLSMYDLRMRGMGDVLGERQSGIPHFILGDIENDQAILQQAKKDALEIIQNLDDNELKAFVELAKQLKMVYN